MNRMQKSIVKWAKLEMYIHGISFYKARKKAKSIRKDFSTMFLNAMDLKESNEKIEKWR